MKRSTTISALGWIGRLAIAFLALVAFGAIAFTAFELYSAGPGGLAEFGFENLTYAWPTVLALAVVIGEPFFLSRVHWRPRSVLVATLAWLASALAYARDFPSVSVRSTIAMLILAGSPILALYSWRLILTRTSTRPGLQLLGTVVAALVLAWLTAPMALVVGCAVVGACP